MRRFLILVLTIAGCSGGNTLSPDDASPGGGTQPDLAGAASVPDLAMGTNPSPSSTPHPTPSPGTGCGTCPSGTTCGSANGIPVCRAASGIPQFSHVFLIVMENTSWGSLSKNKMTPYLHGLITGAAHSANYHGVAHPSLPNYLAMTSGTPGVQSDGTTAVACDCDPVGSTCSGCSSFSTLFASCGCEQMAMHLGDQLEAASKTWRAYGEDMGTACNLTTAGAYATRHVPFLYYDNVQMDSTRCNDHVVDYVANFTTDLGGTLPVFSFIAPNLNHDMHGTGLTQASADITAGDTWLEANVNTILVSTDYLNGGIVFIVWDEDDLSGIIKKDDPIPLFVLSPLAKSGGFESMTKADHYALLATIEDGLGLPRLKGSNGATPLADFFPDN